MKEDEILPTFMAEQDDFTIYKKDIPEEFLSKTGIVFTEDHEDRITLYRNGKFLCHLPEWVRTNSNWRLMKLLSHLYLQHPESVLKWYRFIEETKGWVKQNYGICLPEDV